MQSMAVTYVHDMVHGTYSYSEGTVSPFLMVQWQGRETEHSLSSSADIVNVRSYKPTDPDLNKLSIHCSESIGNFGKLIFYFQIYLYLTSALISLNLKFMP
jgi:hypothetical protein